MRLIFTPKGPRGTDYVLQSGSKNQLIRLFGEPIRGSIGIGDRIRIVGRYSNDIIYILGGHNETLNCRIVVRGKFWVVGFWIMLGLALVQTFIAGVVLK